MTKHEKLDAAMVFMAKCAAAWAGYEAETRPAWEYLVANFREAWADYKAETRLAWTKYSGENQQIEA